MLVASGEYFENINLKGKAIFLTSHYFFNKDTSFISRTIINGSSNNGSVVRFTSGEDTSSVLNGFTITGDKGTYRSLWGGQIGGGIYISGGAKITNNHVINIMIHHNSAQVFGAGIFIDTCLLNTK